MKGTLWDLIVSFHFKMFSLNCCFKIKCALHWFYFGTLYFCLICISQKWLLCIWRQNLTMASGVNVYKNVSWNKLEFFWDLSWFSRWGYSKWVFMWMISILRLRQNGCHISHFIFITDNIFKKSCSWNETSDFPKKILLQYVPQCVINNKPALVQIMVSGCICDKPLSESMMICFNDPYMHHYSASMSQCVFYTSMISQWWYPNEKVCNS